MLQAEAEATSSERHAIVRRCGLVRKQNGCPDQQELGPRVA